MTPRVVVVHRATELDELLARHGTRGQASFFLTTRGRTIDEVDARHAAIHDARQRVAAAIPLDWRRAEVERAILPTFVWGPDDIVVVVGQDGLVANVAKYLTGQPVIGVDPLPGGNAGVLVPHTPADVPALLTAVAAGRATLTPRTMVEATTDDGQTLTALNEIYLGQPGHQSARYRIATADAHERHSSSGVIVGTGTGASGWCASLQRLQAPGLTLPQPDAPGLAWFVREPWPSPSTQAGMVAGLLDVDATLTLDVESDTLVIFGDGMETDRLTIGWGQRVTIRRSTRVLHTAA